MTIQWFALRFSLQLPKEEARSSHSVNKVTDKDEIENVQAVILERYGSSLCLF